MLFGYISQLFTLYLFCIPVISLIITYFFEGLGFVSITYFILQMIILCISVYYTKKNLFLYWLIFLSQSLRLVLGLLIYYILRSICVAILTLFSALVQRKLNDKVFLKTKFSSQISRPHETLQCSSFCSPLSCCYYQYYI